MTNLEAAARTAPPAADNAGDALLADLIARPTPPAAHGAPLPRAAAGYRILRAWQRALDVAATAHRLAAALPDADQPTLGADLRRAGWAVPAGIAAGSLARVAGAITPPAGAPQAGPARTGARGVVSEPRAPAPRLPTTPARATRSRRAGPRPDARPDAP